MTPEISAEKKILRKNLIDKREMIPAEEARGLDKEIALRLFGAGFYKEARSIFVYLSVNKEVDTELIIRKAFEDGKTVCVPRVLKTHKTQGTSLVLPANHVMEAVPIKEADFFQRARTEWSRFFGIPEPSRDMASLDVSGIELAIVPSLALDLSGYRLGYGGGYYDSFIAAGRLTKNKPVFAAIQRAAFIQKKALPRDMYDMPVDAIVTESEIIIPSF